LAIRIIIINLVHIWGLFIQTLSNLQRLKKEEKKEKKKKHQSPFFPMTNKAASKQGFQLIRKDGSE